MHTWNLWTGFPGCDGSGGVALIPARSSICGFPFDQVKLLGVVPLGGGWMNNWDCSMNEPGRDRDAGAWLTDTPVPNSVCNCFLLVNFHRGRKMLETWERSPTLIETIFCVVLFRMVPWKHTKFEISKETATNGNPLWVLNTDEKNDDECADIRLTIHLPF